MTVMKKSSFTLDTFKTEALTSVNFVLETGLSFVL